DIWATKQTRRAPKTCHVDGRKAGRLDQSRSQRIVSPGCQDRFGTRQELAQRRCGRLFAIQKCAHALEGYSPGRLSLHPALAPAKIRHAVLRFMPALVAL